MDTLSCEIDRLLKVNNKNVVEPISFYVPRKSDIYPDAYKGEPALTADEWFGGADKEPVLFSLEDGYVPPPAVEFKPTAVVEDKELSTTEMKAELDKLQKRVAFLEAEMVKKDARIKELEEGAGES